MKKVSMLALLFIIVQCHAQDLPSSAFLKKQLIYKGDTLPYRVLLPENYDPHKSYPLFLFLHGAGERGSDNEKQLVHIAPLFLKDSIRKNYQAIIVFPQCSIDSYWSNMKPGYDSIAKARTFDFISDGKPTTAMAMVLRLLDRLDKDYRIDKTRKYVGGLSMGGMGTFELVRRKPKTFAAAIAICGGANPTTAPQLTHTAWQIFHGLKDNVVNPAFSIRMADALEAAGADVKLTLYPEANHNSWDPAFQEKDLLPWLFRQRLRQ